MKEAVVWILNTKEIESCKNRDALVREMRRKKAMRLCKEEVNRSLGAGYLLQRFCETFQVREGDCQYGKEGKPYFLDASVPAFSLSHSGEWVVLAFLKEGTGEIGVDIQEWRTVSSLFLKRILSEKELAMDLQLSPIQMWTIKEAFSKMTGEGLHLDFRLLSIDPMKKMVEEEGKNRRAYYRKLVLPDSYEGVLCSECALDFVTMEKISLL